MGRNTKKKPTKLTLALSNTYMENYPGQNENGDVIENLPLYFGCHSTDRNSRASKRNRLWTGEGDRGSISGYYLRHDFEKGPKLNPIWYSVVTGNSFPRSDKPTRT